MSIDGRLSLRCLSKILQALWQYAPNVWSLLAQYLFIETSIMRDLLRKSKDLAPTRDATTFIDEDLAPTRDATTFLADYTGFLQVARRYDRQQQALRVQLDREAEE